MKITLLLSMFVSFFSVLHGIEIYDWKPVDIGCWANNFTNPLRVFIRCAKLGADGRTFEQAISEESIPISITKPGHFVNGTNVRSSEWYTENVTITEIAHLVTRIALDDSRNVTLDENSLKRFPNLTELWIWGPSGGQGERGVLNLAPGVFRQTPLLNFMDISRMEIADESIPAFLELKDQLETISVRNVPPEDTVLASLAHFTALRTMEFLNCAPRPFPIDVVKGSSAVLKTFEIENCTLPKLTKSMFANTPNLTGVFLKGAKLVEVEAGAFDHNPQLHYVNLQDNDLQSLPDGLFSSLKNLRGVTLRGNPRLIGSIDRSNFTHVQDFGNFTLNL